MSDDISSQIKSVKEGIDKLKKYEMSARVHCSKVNSLLNAFFSLRPELSTKAIKKKGSSTKKIKKSLKSMISSLDDLFNLVEECSNNSPPEFQDFLLKNSIKSIFDRFYTIRQTTIQSLEAIGLQKSASIFQLTPEELYNQNHVDLKRLYTLILPLRSCRKLYDCPDLLQSLNDRLQSMGSHGFEVPEITQDSLDIPKTNSLIIPHESIHFVKIIGTGRSAFVHLGTIGDNKDIVAIKVLRGRALSQPELTALRREIMVLSSLSHPSLLKLKYYTNDPPFCLVTDFLQNGSLFAFLRSKPEELSPTNRTIIALDVAAGMAYMHEQRVIHRDLKSLNILLDENKRAKVGDFGLSRLLNYEPMSGLVGTAQWMAPEVYLSQPSYDSKVDVYSFGIVLWELLTSKVPYEGIEELMIPKLVVHEQLRPEIPPETPPELRMLICSCWASDPKERPSFQQICQRFSSSQYYFPGTDPSLIPRNNIRHTVSNSDPLKLQITTQRSSTLAHSIPPVQLSKMKTRMATSPKITADLYSPKLADENLTQLLDSIHTHNETKFERVIATIRSNFNQHYFSCLPDQFIRDIQIVLKDADDVHKGKIIRVLDEALNIHEIFESYVKLEANQFLADMLELKFNDTSRAIFNLLENHHQLEFYPVSIIRALLSFYNYKDIKIRSKALKILFFVSEQQRAYLCSIPSFIAHILDFAQFQLSHDLLEQLYNTVIDLLNGIDNLHDSIIERLPQILNVPDDLYPLAVKCIESCLRFQKLRENFPPQLWEQGINHFTECKSFFTCFIEKPPENSAEMISALVEAARTDMDALTILVDMSKTTTQVSKQIMLQLPLLNRSNDSLLIKLYANLINFGGLAQDVYNENEFYSVCFSLLRNGFNDYVYGLLSSENVNLDLAEPFGYIPAICKQIMAATDPDVLWTLLNVVYKWLKIRYNKKFESIINKLQSLLREKEKAPKLGSFLCLTIMYGNAPSKINGKDVMIAAMCYVNEGTEPVQELCYEFVENNQQLLSKNLTELATAFLKFYKKTSNKASSVASLIRKADRKQKHILPQEDHQRIVSICRKSSSQPRNSIDSTSAQLASSTISALAQETPQAAPSS